MIFIINQVQLDSAYNQLYNDLAHYTYGIDIPLVVLMVQLDSECSYNQLYNDLADHTYGIDIPLVVITLLESLYY